MGLGPKEPSFVEWKLSLAMGLGGIDVFPLDQDVPRTLTLLTLQHTRQPIGGPWRNDDQKSFDWCASTVGKAVADIPSPAEGRTPAGLSGLRRLRSSFSFGPTARSRCAALRGFSTCDLLEPTRVLRPVALQEFQSLESLLKRRRQSDGICWCRKFRHCFCWRPVQKSFKRGVASDLFTKDELDQKHGKGFWLPIERFEMSQGARDSRATDDGAKCGHGAGKERDRLNILCPSPGWGAPSFRLCASLFLSFFQKVERRTCTTF